MRLFIDESLSPSLAIALNQTGRHDAVHPLHLGRRGEPDHRVVERCLAEDRVIVTQNARDFRKLVAALDLHPGLILLPAADKPRASRLLTQAIEHLSRLGDPMDAMVNHVLALEVTGGLTLAPLTRNSS